MTDRVKLWEAVNRYAQTCGGDTSAETASVARCDAVVAVERAVDALVAAQRHSDACVGRIHDSLGCSCGVEPAHCANPDHMRMNDGYCVTCTENADVADAPESGGKTCGTCGSVLCCDLPSLAMRCPRCNPAPESEGWDDRPSYAVPRPEKE